VALASVLARVAFAVIDVDLAIGTLETRLALAQVVAYLVNASGTVQTRSGVTLIDLVLAVGAGETVLAEASVAVAHVLAGAVVAQPLD